MHDWHLVLNCSSSSAGLDVATSRRIVATFGQTHRVSTAHAVYTILPVHVIMHFDADYIHPAV